MWRRHPLEAGMMRTSCQNSSVLAITAPGSQSAAVDHLRALLHAAAAPTAAGWEIPVLVSVDCHDRRPEGIASSSCVQRPFMSLFSHCAAGGGVPTPHARRATPRQARSPPGSPCRGHLAAKPTLNPLPSHAGCTPALAPRVLFTRPWLLAVC